MNDKAKVQSDKKNLTKRQIQVLEGIGKGESIKETAARLKIRDRTVEVHRARSMQVLGTHKSSHAYILALKGGLLNGDKKTEKNVGKSRELLNRERECGPK